MEIIEEDTYKLVREKALKHLEELCLKSIGELRDIPELEYPNEEQRQWLKRKGVKL